MYRRLLILCVSLFVASAAAYGQTTTYKITEVELTGARYTNKRWLKNYLDLSESKVLSDLQIEELRNKLLTTAVYTRVETALKRIENSDDYKLIVDVTEKWTLIPVIRAVYGGGTPLRVFGIYDTHVSGQLYTLGGEVRKYGDAPMGYVLYFRSPRHSSGRFFIGGEFWRDHHRRSIYGRSEKLLGVIGTDATIGRARFLMPVRGKWHLKKTAHLKAGFDIKMISETATTFQRDSDAPTEEEPEGIRFLDSTTRSNLSLLTLLYDDVLIDNLSMHGRRVVLKGGAFSESSHRSKGHGQLDIFYYQRWTPDITFGSHLLVGGTDTDSIQAQYYLGGFDSIRGLPDGIVHGSKAAYANVELRMVTHRMKYLWFQNVVFSDSGFAASDWSDASDQLRSSAGVGIRFSIPQVYRLIFRIDYARSIDGRGYQGVTAGMNQLFQPYRPL